MANQQNKTIPTVITAVETDIKSNKINALYKFVKKNVNAEKYQLSAKGSLYHFELKANSQQLKASFI